MLTKIRKWILLRLHGWRLIHEKYYYANRRRGEWAFKDLIDNKNYAETKEWLSDIERKRV